MMEPVLKEYLGLKTWQTAGAPHIYLTDDMSAGVYIWIKLNYICIYFPNKLNI